MDAAAHRRIELQSPEDLAYLIDNVRRAAADSINAAFPPVDHPLDGHDEDELRNRIEQLVNDVRPFSPPPSRVPPSHTPTTNPSKLTQGTTNSTSSKPSPSPPPP